MKQKYAYRQDSNMWLGYLEDYRNYWRQGKAEDELQENLTNIYQQLHKRIEIHLLLPASRIPRPEGPPP